MKKTRQTGKKEEFAYVIEDKVFGELKIKNSANAWWLNRVKLENLISVYKMGGTNEEACAYAGISVDQYKYFKEIHPEFSAIKDQCKQLPTLRARKTVVNSLDSDKDMAFKYLERKKPNEFSNKPDMTISDIPSGFAVEIIRKKEE